MQYDPIKRSLGKIFNQSIFLRKVFYFLLDILLLRSWHVRRELRFIKKQLSSANILDAGAGFGQYTWFMARLSKKWSIRAVEIKQEQVEDCNRFLEKTGYAARARFEEADLTKFTAPGQFDLIISVDVMEHIEEDELVLRNFYESLKDGGQLLISTPSDQGGSDVHHEDEHSFIDEHVRDGYSVQDITSKLQAAGFKDIDARYTYGAPGKLSWKLSMKYPITWLNASKAFFIFLPLYYTLTMPLVLLFNWLDLHGRHATGTGLLVKAKK